MFKISGDGHFNLAHYCWQWMKLLSFVYNVYNLISTFITGWLKTMSGTYLSRPVLSRYNSVVPPHLQCLILTKSLLLAISLWTIPHMQDASLIDDMCQLLDMLWRNLLCLSWHVHQSYSKCIQAQMGARHPCHSMAIHPVPCGNKTNQMIPLIKLEIPVYSSANPNLPITCSMAVACTTGMIK